ncbi:ABC transporter ATP-binding protein [Gynuella sunshinyii]|uniref:ABC-type branched-chain amino acid transport system, ATPase component n=1 Tax=Gynuella sunshinyii YC6258 TaxID=1445510 RepID=A0A0C5VK50_9GAMM|nr:ABC transporter ATP-binding protein [Gynuella sunshinyii]AJQ94651.1 ABC-type branched-chain amino acid transport system, ATPase component [Gynuella sunshinyii YC6258]
MAVLEVKNIHGGYGGMNILNGVDISIEQEQIGVIVGPNGAGKSTCLKAIFGLLNVTEGSIRLRGEEIRNAAPEELVRKGMAFVPQEKNVFVSLTVEENLQMGAFSRKDDFRHMLERVYEFFPPLKEKRHQAAGELSGGQRQMVAMGRALMIEPSVLLLDEPTAGLSPLFMNEIFDRIITINKAGVGILMVEQHARQALKIAHKGFVLAGGMNRFTDTGHNLIHDPEVAKSFLGG